MTDPQTQPPAAPEPLEVTPDASGKFTLPENLEQYSPEQLAKALRTLEAANNQRVDDIETDKASTALRVERLHGDLKGALQKVRASTATFRILGEVFQTLGYTFSADWDTRAKRLNTTVSLGPLLELTSRVNAELVDNDEVHVTSSPDCLNDLHPQPVELVLGTLTIDGLNTLISAQRYAQDNGAIRECLPRRLANQIYASPKTPMEGLPQQCAALEAALSHDFDPQAGLRRIAKDAARLRHDRGQAPFDAPDDSHIAQPGSDS